jgi:hypothetical protein
MAVEPGSVARPVAFPHTSSAEPTVRLSTKQVTYVPPPTELLAVTTACTKIPVFTL